MKVFRYACKACSRWFEFEAGEDEKFGESLACPFCPEGTALGLRVR